MFGCDNLEGGGGGDISHNNSNITSYRLGKRIKGSNQIGGFHISQNRMKHEKYKFSFQAFAQV